MAWGMLTAIDLHDCALDKITDKEYISRFAKDLVELLDMRAFGEPLIEHFGDTEEVAGFTLVQLIYTSHIAAHFVNSTRAVYLDIFSCKDYSVKSMLEFCSKRFAAQSISSNIIIRR